MRYSWKGFFVKKMILLLFYFLGTPNLFAQGSEEFDVLSVSPSLSISQWEAGQSGDLILNVHLTKGYHAYAERFQLEIEQPLGFTSGKLRISPLKTWYDKPTKRNRQGIENDGLIKVNIEAPREFLKSSNELVFKLTYQACSETVCLLPFTKTVHTPITLLGSPVSVLTNPTSALSTSSLSVNSNSLLGFLSEDRFHKLMDRSLFLTLLFVFMAGILTSFTPCIFPMIPITLAILGKEAEKHKRLQNFLLSIFYVLGIAMTYSSMGVVVSMTGGVFGSSLGNPMVLAVMSFLFLLMSLSMFGLFEIQMPLFIQNRLSKASVQKGYAGAFISGLFAGVVASPCVGPVLIGILTYVSTQKNPFLGFILLFTYALGLGLIFILLGLFNQLFKYLPRSGPWMLFSKFILGSLMLSAFYYYFHLLVPPRVFDFALGMGLVVLASVYGAFMNSESSHISEKWRPYMRIRKGHMLVLLYLGIGFILTAVFDFSFSLNPLSNPTVLLQKQAEFVWSPYDASAFEKAKTDGKPILIDVRADWCGACLELEEQTFSDPEVIEVLKNFTLLKFDATRNSPELDVLTKTYDIKGLPFVIFLDSKGDWLKPKTLTHFESPKKFLQRLKEPSTSN